MDIVQGREEIEWEDDEEVLEVEKQEMRGIVGIFL